MKNRGLYIVLFSPLQQSKILTSEFMDRNQHFQLLWSFLKWKKKSKIYRDEPEHCPNEVFTSGMVNGPFPFDSN